MLILHCYGSCIGEALATDFNLDDSTDSENVKFQVYLDENDVTKKQISKEINSEDLNLFVTVKVKEGRLENPKIDFSNSNFEAKDNNQIFERKIQTINSGSELAFKLPIVSRKNSSYDLSLLNMVSKIKLNGQYVDANGEVTDINATKEINIEWTTNEITEEALEISQEVITNKIYNMDGINKRVIQVLVKSNLKQNIAPVKSTRVEVQVPELEVKPEQVKVAAKGTKATNGKTDIEFGNLEVSKYEYIEDEGKVYIDVLNNYDENNKVSCEKDCQDEFIVTYIYNEETSIIPFVSKVKSSLNLYGRTEQAIEKENELALEEIEIIGDVAILENDITNKIYKGNMYLEEETNYETKWNTFISYAELAKNIILQDLGDTADLEGLNSYYKSTKINRANAINILGEEGTVKIYNAENLETPLTEIDLSQENLEDYITFEYEENINKIIIETSEVLKEGKLEITNEKVIKVESEAEIENATKLDSKIRLILQDSQKQVTVDFNKIATSALEEPVTTIEIMSDKTSISNQVENTMRLTAVLKASNNSNKLFKNPVIDIEFPKEITEVSIESITPVIGDEKLTIKSYEIITNEAGNKALRVEIEGEQTKYNANEATIVMDLKVSALNFMSDKNVELKTTCINDGENVETKNILSIVAKEGILTKNSIKIGEQELEQINDDEIIVNGNSNLETAKISTKLINNHKENITNVNVVGTIKTSLLGPINTNIQDAIVYYSKEENSDEWSSEVENYAEIKAFKIVLNNEVSKAEELEVNYDISLIEGNSEDNLLSTININYNIGEQNLNKEINYKQNKTANYFTLPVATVAAVDENSYDIQLLITPKTTLKTLHEGQIVTYVVSAKNTGNTNLNNLKLEYTVPEGATYTELTYAQGSDIEFTDNSELTSKVWDIETLEAGKAIEKEVTIKINKGTTNIENTIKIKDENQEIISEVTTEAVEVKPAELAILLSRRDNMEITLDEGKIITYIVAIKNTSSSPINNIVVNSKIPENTVYVDESEYNKDWSYNEKENIVYFNISELGANETKFLGFEVKVINFPQNVKQAKIDNTVIVKTENEEEYETNVFTSNVKTKRWELNLSSSNSKELKEGEIVKYIITAKNVGMKNSGLTIIDNFPKEIQVYSAKMYINGEFKHEISTITDNSIYITWPLESEETLTIEIEGIACSLDSEQEKVEVRNLAKIDGGLGEYIESNEISNIIINADWVKPDSTPDSKPDVKDKYSISGLVWLDENKNGIRENNEKILTDVNAILLDEQGNIVKDEQEKNIEAKMLLTGTYKFNNLAKGKYSVVFVYDTEKYSITKYKVKDGAEETNSDAISKKIKIDNKELVVGVTDTINIETEDVKNIDLGLVQNAKFDLSLAKYIDKVIVTNAGGTSTYNFEDTNFAKVEIAAKYLSSSTVLIEYGIKITNEGDVDGYVEDIMDYIPKDVNFNSELNPDWYLDQSGNLHNGTLAKQAIKSGETAKVKLVVTKTTTGKSQTITNLAEIGTSSNLEGIEEFDSVAGNNKQAEDDMGKAELIVSIKTGSPVMYIGIVLVSLAIMGTGIYLINKKVLKGGKD